MRSGSVGTANAYRKAGDVVRSHVVVRYVTLLMEEADRQKVQYARQAPRKGKEEGEEPQDEALSSVSSKPRKGKGRENITCWNCD